MNHFSTPQPPQHPGTATAALLTLFRADGGKPISGTVAYRNSRLEKVNAGEMATGSYEVVALPTLEDFRQRIICGGYGPDFALCYGIPMPELALAGRVTSERLEKAGKAEAGAIRRTAESFPFRAGMPGIAFHDLDGALPVSKDWTAEQYDRELCQALPWLAAVQRLYVPSARSEIYTAAGEMLSPARKWHLYFMVSDAGRIPDLGNEMFAALYDHGYRGKAKNGELQTLIDRSAWTRARLDFAFPGLEPGLVRGQPGTPAWRMFQGNPRLEVASVACRDFDGWKREQSGRRAKSKTRQAAPVELSQLHPQLRVRHAGEMRIKLQEDVAALRNAGSGERQAVLNTAVLRNARYVREGMLPRDELEHLMRDACMQNGYIRDDGQVAFDRQFEKALSDGWGEPLRDLDAGIKAAMSDAAGFAAVDDEQLPLLQRHNVAEMLKRQAPPREWTVQDWIPHKQVTLLYGDGGGGKTTLLLQLGIRASQGLSWLGMPTTKRRVLFISAEDETGELHLRLQEMCKALGGNPVDFDFITLAELARAELVNFHGNNMEAAPLLKSIVQHIKATRADLVMMDPVADLFSGNDVDRRQVNGFIRLLRKLICFDLGCSLIIAAHPSESGMRSGKGTSGSTAWSNGCRSRMFFKRGDDGISELELMKANRAKAGGKVTMKWVNGVFIVSEPAAARLPTKCLEVFLRLMAQHHNEGVMLSPSSNAGSYAPKVFAEHHRAEGFTKEQFKTAMGILREKGEIFIEPAPKDKRVGTTLWLSQEVRSSAELRSSKKPSSADKTVAEQGFSPPVAELCGAPEYRAPHTPQSSAIDEKTVVDQ